MSTPGVVNVDPDGDIILVCGKENENMIQLSQKIRVHSAIVSRASPVFKAMLGPHFKEGQMLATSTASPVEVPLPEDEPRMMRWLCSYLHHRHDMVPWGLDVDKQFVFAELCDKYDCTVAVQPLTSRWVVRSIPMAGDEDNDEDCDKIRGRLLTILGEESVVRTIARDTMLKCEKFHRVLANVGAEVPMKLISVLEGQIVRCKEELDKMIEGAINDQVLSCSRSCRPGCTACSVCVFSFVEQLKAVGLWPTTARKAMSLATTFEKVEHCRLVAPRVEKCGERCSGITPNELKIRRLESGRIDDDNLSDDYMSDGDSSRIEEMRQEIRDMSLPWP